MKMLAAMFRIAFDAVRSNKLRSTLTLLGIVFGVTSVMTIMSALDGMMGEMEKQLRSLGPSTFMVSKMMMAFSEEEFREKIKRKPIQMEHAELIEDNCVLCNRISPRAYWNEKVKWRDKTLRDVTIMGGTSEFTQIISFEVESGRFHSSEDDLYGRRVAFIGNDIREELFPGVDPLGKNIRIGGTKYSVIGTAKKQGEMFGNSQDDFVIIPIKAAFKQFGEPRRGGINVVIEAVSPEQLDAAMDEVRVLLRAYRHVPYNEPDDFDMLTAESALEMLNNFTFMFRATLILVSAISLVIGGIVVMNIMMVAVTERTREIGIRKSLGAKRSHVLLQFLLEALILTATGGFIGVAIGFMLAKILVGQIGMDISPSMLAIGLGLLVSGGTGLIFGVYPALKASRLDPVKALSFE